MLYFILLSIYVDCHRNLIVIERPSPRCLLAATRGAVGFYNNFGPLFCHESNMSTTMRSAAAALTWVILTARPVKRAQVKEGVMAALQV